MVLVQQLLDCLPDISDYILWITLRLCEDGYSVDQPVVHVHQPDLCVRAANIDADADRSGLAPYRGDQSVAPPFHHVSPAPCREEKTVPFPIGDSLFSVLPAGDSALSVQDQDAHKALL